LVEKRCSGCSITAGPTHKFASLSSLAALDNQSEGIVQDCLDKSQANRTTITIAHRLSTIRNTTRIFVMDHGQIIEEVCILIP
jgi:ABC-type methionine transport system ATPase subunit